LAEAPWLKPFGCNPWLKPLAETPWLKPLGSNPWLEPLPETPWQQPRLQAGNCSQRVIDKNVTLEQLIVTVKS